MKAVKNKIKFILLFAIMLLFNIGVSKVNAQTFPLSGATWIFKDNTPIWTDDFSQKWEYISDSITVDESAPKTPLSRKTLKIG